MDIVILVIVGITCAYVSAGIFNSKECNKVFNKKPIEVEDIRKYNRACGFLVIGFGGASEITFFLGFCFGQITSAIAPIVLIVEAAIVLKIYESIEKKHLKKR